MFAKKKLRLTPRHWRESLSRVLHTVKKPQASISKISHIGHLELLVIILAQCSEATRRLGNPRKRVGRAQHRGTGRCAAAGGGNAVKSAMQLQKVGGIKDRYSAIARVQRRTEKLNSSRGIEETKDHAAAAENYGFGAKGPERDACSFGELWEKKMRIKVIRKGGGKVDH